MIPLSSNPGDPPTYALARQKSFWPQLFGSGSVASIAVSEKPSPSVTDTTQLTIDRGQVAIRPGVDVSTDPVLLLRLAVLSAETGLAVLDEVNHLLRDAPHRPKDGDGNAGGLVELPADSRPIVVGDLHARLDNLLKILSENGLMEGLERGDVSLILLGDEVHPELDDQIEEMDSSVLMMDLVFRLMLRFPSQVFFLLGNHDSFSTEVMKRGVPQGLLWRKRLQALRGDEYVEQMELLYQQSPLVAVAEGFVACHAGPPRASVSREALIEIRRFPALVHELTWTRARTPAFPAGYGPSDVARFRKSLGLSKEIPLIVAHHPVSDISPGAISRGRPPAP